MTDPPNDLVSRLEQYSKLLHGSGSNKRETWEDAAIDFEMSELCTQAAAALTSRDARIADIERAFRAGFEAGREAEVRRSLGEARDEVDRAWSHFALSSSQPTGGER